MACLLSSLAGCGNRCDEIVCISRQNNSGTFAYFREAVLGESEIRLGTIDLNGSKDVVEMVSKTRTAIGYSGMGYATREVKMLRISVDGTNPVAPSMETASSGEYPLARPLYIFTVGAPAGAVKHYIDWILSSSGQKIVADLGMVPAPGGPAPAPPTTVRGSSVKIAGSDTMVNLAQAWAEEYSDRFPQVRPEVSGGGTGVGIAKLIDGTIAMANASREIKPDERQQIEKKFGKKVHEFIVGLDALAVFVHRENPLDSISMSDLAEIYRDEGTVVAWSQVKGWPVHASSN
jgi:ABC-type phosphate transport system substrate-binding protein